jgi:cytochrome c553
LVVWLLCQHALGDEKAQPQRLGRDARAILSRACFECHGAQRQEADLRLDVLGHSKEELGREILRRVSLPKEHEEVMPNRGEVLSPADVQRLEAWIASGMPWDGTAREQVHWSYVPPRKVEFPAIPGQSHPNPVDAFVASRLWEQGMALARSQDARILCRRIYLDSIGLPPRVADVEAFVAACEVDVDQAVAHLVDRLLAMPQYGEKWARPWLDAARYADSHGFQRDDLHDIWSYRDWVIRALNDDMPFDRFTIEQLAGDLLPNPTTDQLIATGFNRCAPCNVEAGTDPEENRFNQVVDRVNTLGYVWLGTSLECAQCHDHKYDPFTRRDYYGLFAYFNQTELEADRSNPKVPGSIRFLGPYLELKSPRDEEEGPWVAKIADVKSQLAELAKSTPTDNPPSARQILRPIEFRSVGGASHQVLPDGSILLQDDPPEIDTYIVTFSIEPGRMTGILLETLTDPSLPGTGPGRGDEKRPNFVLNAFDVYPVGSDGKSTSTKIAFQEAVADFSQARFPVENAIDDDDKTAWAIGPQFFKDHWAAFRLKDPASLQGFEHIQIRLVQNNGNARTIGRFRVWALWDDFAMALPSASREHPRIAVLRKELKELENQRKAKKAPRTLVMRETDQPRQSTMYERGDFRSPGEVVQPSTPAVLHALPSDAPGNRLGLARWLVSRDNPLVARVVVNRLWADVFGAGLVTTPEDFGLKGDFPSHPPLLDWLAVEFMERGWSQKGILRLILNSQTYRQSSTISANALESDPHNTLLARGPRFRLDAESIRDNALSIAGLLSLKQFGPPIRPPQPAGLWTKVGGEKYEYETSPGEDQHRRGIYVVLKRMSPYPSMITFDATARLACRVKRGRSNTPLQALTLLNDPVFVGAAKAFAQRIVSEQPSKPRREQLRYAFQCAVARAPREVELDALEGLWDAENSAGRESLEDVAQAPAKAWYAVATALLNLDETITKE